MVNLNIEKCIKILEKKGADALVLMNEANMHYVCGFSPSEGMVVIFANSKAYHLVDSRYTEHSGSADFISADNSLTLVSIDSLDSHCIPFEPSIM